MALWNASLNQNLLHESMSPFATRAEGLVIDWPPFLRRVDDCEPNGDMGGA